MFALLCGLVLLTACAAAVYQLSRSLSGGAAFVASLLLVGLVAGIPGVLFAPVLRESKERADLSQATYKTSLSCRKCHAEQYASWHRTFHRTMTQDPLPENVLGDFDNVTVNLNGVNSRLFRAGDRFGMELINPRWEAETLLAGKQPRDNPHPPTVSYIVDRLVGSHHFQIYLTEFPNGEFRVLPLVWLVEEQRWTSRSGHLLRPEAEHLYTDATPWNTNCAFCHNTKVKPRMTVAGIDPLGPPQSGIQFQTQLTEMGIACESCHGPGERHVAANLNPVRRYALNQTGRDDPTIVNPAKLPKELSQEVCSRCHGRWYVKDEYRDQTSLAGDLFIPGGERLSRNFTHGFAFFDKAVDSVEPNNDYFWPDWTPRPAAMENQGMVLSPCYQRGEMTCVSCHSMHRSDPNDQLIFPDTHATASETMSRACTQCHAEYRDREAVEKHSHHPADSAASNCYNCHMPYQSFGLLTAKRTHRVSNPDVSVTAETGLPNACNQCHIDRSLQWTTEWMARWYRHDLPALSEDQKTLSAGVRDLLTGDAVMRALAATQMSWPPAREAAPGKWPIGFLIEALNDTYPLVRLSAYRSIRSFPDFRDIEFDYMAVPERRGEQVEVVRRQWQETNVVDATPPSDAVPLDPRGRPVRDVLRRLLDNQDRTVIMLSE